jgi:general secretion pathway protein G
MCSMYFQSRHRKPWMARTTKIGDPMPKKNRGFTLIELLVVLTLLAILAAMVTPQYLERAQEARETVLRDNLHQTRKLIDQFYRDQSRYPSSLQELVVLKYLRDLPMDPLMSRKDAWIIVKPENQEGVIDLKSSAPGRSKDGSAYVQW